MYTIKYRKMKIKYFVLCTAIDDLKDFLNKFFDEGRQKH